MIEIVHMLYVGVMRATWFALPLALTLVALLVVSVPLNLMGGQIPAPDLVLICIFYWAMNGRSFMPAWGVFVLGLAQDLMMGTPAGFYAVLYLFAYGFTLTQRIFFQGRTGIGVWLGFALIAGLTIMLGWLLGMIVFERWIPPAALAAQCGLTVLVYPVCARVLTVLRRVLTTAPETA